MRVLIVLLIFSTLFVKGQNLVPNPSFELYSSCPTTYSELDSALFWFDPALWGSSDYYNSCSGTSVIGVPYNKSGFQLANTGNAYAGLYLGASPEKFVREYISVQLTQPLDSNQRYRFEMYTNISDSSKYTTSNIGVRFSESIIINESGTNLYALTAHATNDSTNIMNEFNWTLVSLIYIAHGGENYLMIGNFDDDDSTNLILSAGTWTIPYSYCYIDDVSLIEEDDTTTTNDSVGIQKSILLNSKLEIYPNPSNYKIKLFSQSESNLSIYNIQGALINNFELHSGNNILDISELNKGVYILKLYSSNNIQIGRLIKE